MCRTLHGKSAAAAANAEIGVGISGIAGPSGGYLKNPSELFASAFISAGKRMVTFPKFEISKRCISVRREGRLSAMQA